MKLSYYLIIFFLSIPIILSAQAVQKGLIKCTPFSYTLPDGTTITLPQGPCSRFADILETVQLILRFIVQFSFWLALLLLAVGSFMILLGGPRPDLISQGWTLVKTAVIGYLIILVSGIMIDLVLNILKVQEIQWQSFDFFLKFALAKEDLPPEIPKSPSTYFNWLKFAGYPRCAQGADNSWDAFVNCVLAVSNSLKILASLLLVLGFLWAGVLMISSPFTEEKTEFAKKIIIWTIIGFSVIILASLLVDLIKWLSTP